MNDNSVNIEDVIESTCRLNESSDITNRMVCRECPISSCSMHPERIYPREDYQDKTDAISRIKTAMREVKIDQCLRGSTHNRLFVETVKCLEFLKDMYESESDDIKDLIDNTDILELVYNFMNSINGSKIDSRDFREYIENKAENRRLYNEYRSKYIK